MSDDNRLLRKQGRIKKLEKRKRKTKDATLAGQVLRMRIARDYVGKKRHQVRIKI
jgi:hypothetical protein